MKFMKKLGNKEQGSLVQMLHERIAGMRKARSMKHIHASDLTYEQREFCPREYALIDITHKKRMDEFISTSLQTTFDNGEEIQSRLNNDWLQDVMVGNWECQSCGERMTMCKKPKLSCGKSGVRCRWKYEEPRVISKHSGIGCGLDALLDVGKTKLLIVEIKTMAQDSFKKLLSPLAEHRTRTRLYMRCAEESDMATKLNTKTAKVLYVSRGYGTKAKPLPVAGRMDAPFSPFKEFDVVADHDSVEDIVEAAREVTLFRKGEGPIPKGVCKNYACARAKQCPVVKECFSGKFKAGEMYNDGDT